MVRGRRVAPRAPGRGGTSISEPYAERVSATVDYSARPPQRAMSSSVVAGRVCRFSVAICHAADIRRRDRRASGGLPMSRAKAKSSSGSVMREHPIDRRLDDLIDAPPRLVVMDSNTAICSRQGIASSLNSASSRRAIIGHHRQRRPAELVAARLGLAILRVGEPQRAPCTR